MMKYLFAVAVTLVVLAMMANTGESQQGNKEVKITKQWSGSVEDQALQKEGPPVIADAKTLDKLWKSWKIGETAPEIDFTKEIVLVTTSVGSVLHLSADLDKKENLRSIAMATMDLRPGFRYVVAAVSREGVKTVDGKQLPK